MISANSVNTIIAINLLYQGEAGIIFLRAIVLNKGAATNNGTKKQFRAFLKAATSHS
jgi:hypothetical protein